MQRICKVSFCGFILLIYIGIYSHALFKIWFLREWRFESAHWYHSLQENIKPTYVGFFVSGF